MDKRMAIRYGMEPDQKGIFLYWNIQVSYMQNI